MKQIKISLVENGDEKDFIARELPLYKEYNFPKGILIDLHLILNRNKLEEEWIIEQLRDLKLLD